MGSIGSGLEVSNYLLQYISQRDEPFLIMHAIKNHRQMLAVAEILCSLKSSPPPTWPSPAPVTLSLPLLLSQPPPSLVLLLQEVKDALVKGRHPGRVLQHHPVPEVAPGLCLQAPEQGRHDGARYHRWRRRRRPPGSQQHVRRLGGATRRLLGQAPEAATLAGELLVVAQLLLHQFRRHRHTLERGVGRGEQGAEALRLKKETAELLNRSLFRQM